MFCLLSSAQRLQGRSDGIAGGLLGYRARRSYELGIPEKLVSTQNPETASGPISGEHPEGFVP
jgi:hypothetical protein